MYLEKLEVQGFKSFASKNVLVFPGMLGKDRRGITAVVGPNGSGKSNVADAIRWALGEQSMKTLRGKKSEDVIFSGSDKKGKLGMAEVSMFFNNEDKKAPIDYSQVVFTRRLYRNGDSEYLLNNNRVRLSDIQMLLAKAKFGQKTYSVIGQGVVEGFLNTTLSERKEFFDEATGVKQFQIKRDESLNKLKASYENLIQAQMLITEIEPRLKSLTRQVGRLQKRGEIENELKDLQLKYYGQIWHDINGNFSKYNEEFLELEKEKILKDKKLASLNSELEKLETESGKDEEYSALQEKLTIKQSEKEEINKKLARLEAQTEVQLEANGQFDLSFLLNKKSELVKDLKNIEEEVSVLQKNIEFDKSNGEELNKEKESLDKKINDLNQEIRKINEEASGDDFKEVNKRLNRVFDQLSNLEKEEDVKKIKEQLNKIKKEIQAIIAESKNEAKDESGPLNGQWQEKQDYLNKLIQEKEVLSVKINENNLRISARSERVKLLKEKEQGLKREVEQITEKLDKKSAKFDVSKINEEQSDLKKGLEKVEQEIGAVKNKIDEINLQEDKEKSRLFSLQRDLQSLQNEINILNNRLNELKINSTRYETKLEDLEIEIRREYGNLKNIKEHKVEDEINTNEFLEKITQAKRQLELIGGIDPQVEEEYKETQERFDFLSGQVNDLTGAIDSLEKIIKELDHIIRDQFDKEFRIIAKKFEEYFKILFNGGTAKIIKVMEDAMKKEEPEDVLGTEEKEEKTKGGPEVADIKRVKFLQKHNATGLAGIEIQATPPGKKIKSISMLSGGERALTAIALISAIISANPSPFVVLDEVDAALDEANSERLAKILDDLSHKTQFIVITHNRASMRRANVLYGVTMGDDGVSKLLSVKLDDVKTRQ